MTKDSKKANFYLKQKYDSNWESWKMFSKRIRNVMMEKMWLLRNRIISHNRKIEYNWPIKS